MPLCRVCKKEHNHLTHHVFSKNHLGSIRPTTGYHYNYETVNGIVHFIGQDPAGKPLRDKFKPSTTAQNSIGLHASTATSLTPKQQTIMNAVVSTAQLQAHIVANPCTRGVLDQPIQQPSSDSLIDNWSSENAQRSREMTLEALHALDMQFGLADDNDWEMTTEHKQNRACYTPGGNLKIVWDSNFGKVHADVPVPCLHVYIQEVYERAKDKSAPLRTLNWFTLWTGSHPLLPKDSEGNLRELEAEQQWLDTADWCLVAKVGLPGGMQSNSDRTTERGHNAATTRTSARSVEHLNPHKYRVALLDRLTQHRDKDGRGHTAEEYAKLSGEATVLRLIEKLKDDVSAAFVAVMDVHVFQSVVTLLVGQIRLLAQGWGLMNELILVTGISHGKPELVRSGTVQISVLSMLSQQCSALLSEGATKLRVSVYDSEETVVGRAEEIKLALQGIMTQVEQSRLRLVEIDKVVTAALSGASWLKLGLFAVAAVAVTGGLLVAGPILLPGAMLTAGAVALGVGVSVAAGVLVSSVRRVQALLDELINSVHFGTLSGISITSLVIRQAQMSEAAYRRVQAIQREVKETIDQDAARTVELSNELRRMRDTVEQQQRQREERLRSLAAINVR